MLYKLCNSAILDTYKQVINSLFIPLTLFDKKANIMKTSTVLNKSQLFKQAHSSTRTIMKKNPNLKYRIVFSFQLKKAIAEQPKKVLRLHANGLATVAYIAKPKKTVNKKVAMVGDYKKPTVNNSNLELPFFMMSLILIIFAIAL